MGVVAGQAPDLPVVERKVLSGRCLAGGGRREKHGVMVFPVIVAAETYR